jgi:hypothetical protein
MPVPKIQQPKQKAAHLSVSSRIGQGVVPLQSQMGAIAQKIQFPSYTYQPAIQVDSVMFTSNYVE